MDIRFVRASLFASVFAIFTSSQVAAISIDELTDGDIDLYDEFYLDIGSNSFIGTISHGLQDYDRFVFVVPDNVIAQFSFSHEFNLDETFITGSYTWTIEQLLSPTDPSCGGVCEDPVLASQQYGSGAGLVVDSIYNFETLPFLSSGAYSIGVAGGVGGQSDSIMSYQSDLVVSAVPVPAAIWLFGSGLVGLIGVARRNKA